jgi:hypothetical protein
MRLLPDGNAIIVLILSFYRYYPCKIEFVNSIGFVFKTLK